jgi:hypothetical protein
MGRNGTLRARGLVDCGVGWDAVIVRHLNPFFVPALLGSKQSREGLHVGWVTVCFLHTSYETGML